MCCVTKNTKTMVFGTDALGVVLHYVHRWTDLSTLLVPKSHISIESVRLPQRWPIYYETLCLKLGHSSPWLTLLRFDHSNSNLELRRLVW